MSAFKIKSHKGSKKEYFIKNTTFENDLFYGICKIIK